MRREGKWIGEKEKDRKREKGKERNLESGGT